MNDRPTPNERPGAVLTEAALTSLAGDIEAIRRDVAADLGAGDERYFRDLLKLHAALNYGGRAIIFVALLFHPDWEFPFASWTVMIALLAVGVFTLGAGKILDNMEIGHNVMHGQWDWLRDPAIRASTWEWDNACPSAHWRNFHNVIHHDWTNVLGKDRDLGFGALRVDPRQRWRATRLAQPISSTMLGLFFEWGLASHGVQLGEYRRGRMSRETLDLRLKQIVSKGARQIAKDYLLWPLLAGPLFLWAAAAHFAANMIRNVWAYAIIICGHFPESADVFTQEQARDESRGAWYLRQILGTCNIQGGRRLNFWTGHLNHQIEHHLFPDLPSNRYAEIAVRVREICARYGIPYHTAPLAEQLFSAQWKIVRMSLPSAVRRASVTPA